MSKGSGALALLGLLGARNHFFTSESFSWDPCLAFSPEAPTLLSQCPNLRLGREGAVEEVGCSGAASFFVDGVG